MTKIMFHILIILMVLLAGTATATIEKEKATNPQNQPGDSLSKPDSGNNQQKPGNDSKVKNPNGYDDFIDKNNNGIDDRAEQKQDNGKRNSKQGSGNSDSSTGKSKDNRNSRPISPTNDSVINKKTR